MLIRPPSAPNEDQPFMYRSEREKYNKHEAAYAPLGHAFLAFVLSPFGVLGPSLIRFSAQLAQIKLTRYENYRELRNLPPFSPAELGQLRAKFLSAIFSRFTHLALQAAVMGAESRLLLGAESRLLLHSIAGLILCTVFCWMSPMRTLYELPNLAVSPPLPPCDESLLWSPFLHLLSSPLSFLLHLPAFSHSLASF